MNIGGVLSRKRTIPLRLYCTLKEVKYRLRVVSLRGLPARLPCGLQFTLQLRGFPEFELTIESTGAQCWWPQYSRQSCQSCGDATSGSSSAQRAHSGGGSASSSSS